MKFSKNQNWILPVLMLLLFSCSQNNESETEISISPPESAVLIYPENNTECNEGVIISETETDVLFQWGNALNAGSYMLIINNLKEGTSKKINTQKTENVVRLSRSVTYSWQVKSIGLNNSGTADSEVWSFYNAGNPEQSHPPFPANEVYPKSGYLVEAGSILFQWEATDLDNDISSFKILLDTISTPENILGITSNTSIQAEVNSGQIYYWQVITVDLMGNQSNSPVFQFQVE